MYIWWSLQRIGALSLPGGPTQLIDAPGFEFEFEKFRLQQCVYFRTYLESICAVYVYTEGCKIRIDPQISTLYLYVLHTLLYVLNAVLYELYEVYALLLLFNTYFYIFI
jgi:hypothetical protein